MSISAQKKYPFWHYIVCINNNKKKQAMKQCVTGVENKIILAQLLDNRRQWVRPWWCWSLCTFQRIQSAVFLW